MSVWKDLNEENIRIIYIKLYGIIHQKNMKFCVSVVYTGCPSRPY